MQRDRGAGYLHTDIRALNKSWGGSAAPMGGDARSGIGGLLCNGHSRSTPYKFTIQRQEGMGWNWSEFCEQEIGVENDIV